jgi:DNA-binding NtrC family response regulator
MERAIILACDDVMRPEHVVFERTQAPAGQEPMAAAPNHHIDVLISRRGRLTDESVLAALADCGGHRARAASLLGVSERTLYRHMQRLRGD